LLTFTGCVSATRSRAWLETATFQRIHQQIGPKTFDEKHALPANVSVDDGISTDEAVAVALWRSPILQAELTNLDSSLADFDEARRPANPRLSLLAPIDPRQLALLLAWPIEAIWQAPFRAQAANRELERVAESLVQTVLNIERDVRLAHADVHLAQARIDVLTALAEAWREAADVVESRARAGDTAPTDAAAVRAEAIIAADAVERARREAGIAESRLLALLGAPWPTLPPLSASGSRNETLPARNLLLAQALMQRPDLRAAELAIHVAAARGKWERSRVFSLIATLDGQALRGEWAPHFSPGLQLELPIFSQNQGGVGRADAAVAKAGYLYAATRLTVSVEVYSAYAAVERASASLRAYESVLNALADASISARHAFEDGAESYLVVVDALRRHADARLRSIELDAELARAQAELARAVGGSPTLETP
jgi:cobalt-zinc-cadmium efflux system outer membrane protein